MKWNEFEIKDFKGINEAQNPALNEFTVIENLNFSGKTGTLQSRKGLELHLEKPAHAGLTSVTDLGWETFIADGKEINVYVQKGTVTRLGTTATLPTSISASATSMPVIAISVNPFRKYTTTGQTVVDWDITTGWQWLNKTVITHLVTVADNLVGLYGVAQNIFGDNGLVEGYIYNVTREEWAGIKITQSDTFIVNFNVDDDSDWAVNDTVILMGSYLPLAALKELPNAVANDIVFHHVLNGLRIGFGGQVNRLGLFAGFNNIALIGLTDNTSTLGLKHNVNNLIIEPFNGISEADTFSLTFTAGGTDEAIRFPYGDGCGGTFHYAVTAVLDGYQEKVVLMGSVEDVIDAAKNLLSDFKIRTATLSHRITEFNIYIALTASPADLDRATTYRKVQTISLVDYFGTTTSTITYPAFNQGIELQNALGHSGTTDYMTGWDQAISLPGRVYFVNPYIDRRYTDKIFMSVIGEGFQTHDIVSPQEYLELPLKSGEAITGAEPLPNYDLLVFTNKRVMRVNTYTGQVTDVNNAAGAVSRQGIVNYGDKIAFPSHDKIFITDGITFRKITDNIDSAYKIITDKTEIIATKNPENSGYLFFDGEGVEYSFDPDNGWTINRFSQFTTGIIYPKKYLSDANGLIRFLGTDGDIYIQTDTMNNEGWIIESIELNVNNMGENLRYNDRLVIGGIWIEGFIPYQVTLEYTADGTFTDYSAITLSSILEKQFIQIRKPIVTSKFKFKLTGELGEDTTKTVIKSIGIIWKVLSRGKFGKKASVYSSGGGYS